MECLCLVAVLVIVSYKCEVVLLKFIEAQAWDLPSCSLGLGVSDNEFCPCYSLVPAQSILNIDLGSEGVRSAVTYW